MSSVNSLSTFVLDFGVGFSGWASDRFGVTFGLSHFTVTLSGSTRLTGSFSGSVSVVTFGSVFCSRSVRSEGGDPDESTDGLVCNDAGLF